MYLYLQTQGTGDAARHKVQQYFCELHERLKCQEVAALSVVETHVRERLCMLKQHQEDMNTLLAQIHSVCYQCEKTLQQVSHNTTLDFFLKKEIFWPYLHNFTPSVPLIISLSCLLTGKYNRSGVYERNILTEDKYGNMCRNCKKLLIFLHDEYSRDQGVIQNKKKSHSHIYL